jgi:hypothetical protein
MGTAQSLVASPTTRTILRTFTNIMLTNYLPHGLNILTDPSVCTPEDGLTAILRGGFGASDGTLDALHGSTHVAIGAIGVVNVIMQLQELLGTSPAPSTPQAPPPTI